MLCYSALWKDVNNGQLCKVINTLAGQGLRQAVSRPWAQRAMSCSFFRMPKAVYDMPKSSTSKTRVALGGMTPPAPLSPSAQATVGRQQHLSSLSVLDSTLKRPSWPFHMPQLLLVSIWLCKAHICL